MENWISKHLSQGDFDEIERAIARVEEKTSGEVVPMIVRRSVSVRTAPYLALLSVVSLLFALSIVFHVDFTSTRHLIGLTVGAFIAVAFAFLTTKWEPLQKFFTLDADEEEAAFERAQYEFYRTGIPGTKGRTGVLIFVSLFEHRAFILGDESISAKMNQDSWVEITQAMVAELKRGDFKAGFVTAIEAVGAKLAQEFPRAANDRNELRDHLIIKD